MWRWGVGLFLIEHGLIHAAMWLAPLPHGENAAPFDPKHSWLMSGAINNDLVRILSVVLAAIAAIGFVGGGLGLFAHQEEVCHD